MLEETLRKEARCSCQARIPAFPDCRHRAVLMCISRFTRSPPMAPLLQRICRRALSSTIALGVLGMSSLAMGAPADWEAAELALREALTAASKIEAPLRGALPTDEAIQTNGEVTGLRIGL